MNSYYMVYVFIKVALKNKVSIFTSYSLLLCLLISGKIKNNDEEEVRRWWGEADGVSEGIIGKNTVFMKESHLERCK